MNNIISIFNKYLGVEISRARGGEMPSAKYSVFKFLKDNGYCINEIGRMTGGYGSCAVRNGLNRINGWLEYKDKVALKYWNRLKENENEIIELIKQENGF